MPMLAAVSCHRGYVRFGSASLASLSPLISEGHLTPSSQARGFDRNYRSPAGFHLMRHGIAT